MRALPLLTVLAFLGWVPAAQAQPKTSDRATVETLSAEGTALFREGDSLGAMVKFQAALKLKDVANLHYNLAMCLEKLGKDEEAIEEYKAFIRHPDSSSEGRAKAENRIDRLSQLVRMKQAEAARAAAPVVAPIDSPPKPEHAPKAVAATPVPSQGDRPIIVAPVRTRPRILEWTLIGAGAGIAATGGALYGVAWAAKRDYDKATDFDRKKSLRTKAKRTALIGDILIGTGAAAAATGVILMFTLDATPAASAPVGPVVGGDFVGLTGRF
jgi:tetratricopeptide (TPR) repeat protein